MSIIKYTILNYNRTKFTKYFSSTNEQFKQHLVK